MMFACTAETYVRASAVHKLCLPCSLLRLRAEPGWAAGRGAAGAVGGAGAGAEPAEDAGRGVLPALQQRLPGGCPELRAVLQVLLCLLQPLQ